ncbi:MAG: aldehyde dehydrogenase family protein [Planctomycetaceae bacterium]
MPLGDGPSLAIGENQRGFTYREPWGVVAGIIPWNYPIVLTSWFMFPALLSGNTILIKPAEDTPLSALYIAKLAEEAGFPPGVINVLPGRGEITGQAIAEHPGVKYISFTGSPGVGQAILRTCDRHGTRMKRENGRQRLSNCAWRRGPGTRRPHDRTLHQPALRSNLLHDPSRLRRSKIANDFIDAQQAFFSGLKIGYQADEGTQLRRSSIPPSVVASCRPSRRPSPAAGRRCWPVVSPRCPVVMATTSSRPCTKRSPASM